MNKKKKFSKFYNKSIDKIYRFIFLKVESSEIAQDLTSQVFVKVWDKISKGKGDIENLSAYTFKIAKRELADFYRSRTRFKIIPADQQEVRAIMDDESILANPERFVKVESDFEKIKEALALLSDEFQDVLILRYVNGFSSKEIAELLGKSEGAVRVMVHRALKDLKERLERSKRV